MNSKDQFCRSCLITCLQQYDSDSLKSPTTSSTPPVWPSRPPSQPELAAPCPLSPFPGCGCSHGSHMSSTATTRIPSEQFLYQERGIQRFPDFFTRESCLLSRPQSNALHLTGFLFPVQKLSRLEHILGVLGCFCTNARSETLTAGTVAVWKHRGTPLLHVSSTKEWWGCTRAVVVTSITAWAPPYSLIPIFFRIFQDRSPAV